MKFLAPWFFWSFLSFLPLVAIYFLKVRPRRKDTTAYFLWQKVFSEKKNSGLFSRLRDLWSLLLLALTFGAVCMALTKPEISDDARKDLLILVDNSASMSAGTGKGKRLEQAREAAMEIVKGLDGTQRAAVATIADDLHFLSHMTDDPRQLKDALEEVKPTNMALRVSALEGLRAGNSMEYVKNHRIIFISDGCLDGAALPEGMELLKVGESMGNIGIISADAQFLPGTGQRLAVYYRLASSHKETVKAEIVIKMEGSAAIGKLVSLDVMPGLNPPDTLIIEEAAPGKWTVEIESKVRDELDADNVAYLAVNKPRPILVAVDASEKIFFETAVQSFEKAGGFLQLVEENAQLVLAKSKSPDAPLALIFQPASDSPWVKSVGTDLEGVVPRVKLADHPALRHLDAAGINFVGAKQVELPESALVLVESDQGAPLIWTMSAGGKSAMVVNMDPVASEFYYSALFPVLVHGAAAALAAREEPILATYAPGEFLPVPGAREGELTAVTPPESSPLMVNSKRFGPLEKLGFYSLRNGSGEWLAGCSLLASGESLLDNANAKSTVQPIAKGWPPYLILTVFAMGVLIAESLLYHRRKVG